LASELVKTGIDDIQVDYHWAPIVPGPTNRRTLGQAELLLAGTLLGSSESTIRSATTWTT
jgi:hypothetical protein